MGFLNRLAGGLGTVYGRVNGITRYGPSITAHRLGETVGTIKAYGNRTLEYTGERIGQSAVSGALEKIQKPENQSIIDQNVKRVLDSAVQTTTERLMEPDVQEGLRETVGYAARPIRNYITYGLIGLGVLAGLFALYKMLD